MAGAVLGMGFAQSPPLYPPPQLSDTPSSAVCPLGGGGASVLCVRPPPPRCAMAAWLVLSVGLANYGALDSGFTIVLKLLLKANAVAGGGCVWGGPFQSPGHPKPPGTPSPTPPCYLPAAVGGLSWHSFGAGGEGGAPATGARRAGLRVPQGHEDRVGGWPGYPETRGGGGTPPAAWGGHGDWRGQPEPLQLQEKGRNLGSNGHNGAGGGGALEVPHVVVPHPHPPWVPVPTRQSRRPPGALLGLRLVFLRTYSIPYG